MSDSDPKALEDLGKDSGVLNTLDIGDGAGANHVGRDEDGHYHDVHVHPGESFEEALARGDTRPR
jgi:hypothetical protein